MRYTVAWTRTADANLAEVWLASPDQNGVAAASAEIDIVLRHDAHAKGTEIAEGLRAINLPPLRFLFSADQDNRMVEIALVRQI